MSLYIHTIFSLPPLLSALFFLAGDTQRSTIVIQDLFEEISAWNGVKQSSGRGAFTDYDL